MPADKVGVVANSPSLARFDAPPTRRRPFARGRPVRLVYAGALTPTYELDVVLEAVARSPPGGPTWTSRFDLYGRGDAAERAARRRRAELGIARRGSTFHGRIPIEDVPGGDRRARTSGSPRPGTTSSPT